VPGNALPAPWVIISAGFHGSGGMERANLALAEHLAERGTPLHLVGHSVEAEIARRSNVVAHCVPRPAASFLLGARRLDRRGQAVARSAGAARVVVNGGNCAWDDVNWVHFVHHAWSAKHARAPLWFQAKSRLLSQRARADELARIPRARIVVANSEMTRRHLLDFLGLAPERVHTVYLGSDPTWGPASAAERASARAWLGVSDERPLVVFVGALGYDARKGFDTLLAAWRTLCADSGWDADLVAAGAGRGIGRWVAEAERLGLNHRVRFLGFTERVADLLAAADLLVSPARYEPYGLNVQEAFCRGVPALVSGSAGIAERYPEELTGLILPDPEDDRDLAARLLEWRAAMHEYRLRAETLGMLLRARSWKSMASDIVELAEREQQ
jgi:glycosyltransferase involved in cell wall biosynthesis